MKCKNCGYTYQEGDKFCGGCGINLSNTDEPIESVKDSSKENQMITKIKDSTKSYGTYFLTIIKKPIKTIEKVDRKQVGNSIFTMVLFALFIPLTMYFLLKENVRQFYWYTIEIDFVDTVIKPFFIIAILLILLVATIYAIVKLSKTTIQFVDVLAKFGAFLVIPTVLLFIGVFCSFLGTYELLSIVDSIAAVCFSVTIPLLIYSIKKDDQSGLDAFYCIVITYIVLFILIALVGQELVENIFESFNIFNY